MKNKLLLTSHIKLVSCTVSMRAHVCGYIHALFIWTINKMCTRNFTTIHHRTDRVLKELALQRTYTIMHTQADRIFMRKLWARTYLFVIIIVFVEIYVSCLLAYKYISIANDMYNLIYLPNFVWTVFFSALRPPYFYLWFFCFILFNHVRLQCKYSE